MRTRGFDISNKEVESKMLFTARLGQIIYPRLGLRVEHA